MLLRSLKLKDFRQFRGNQIIEFGSDINKNVTIIMGEIGTGKTTLAQAFTWCLYGITDFQDKLMLCKITESNMSPNSEENVRAELELFHNGVEYTIIREQWYSKDSRGKMKRPRQPSFKIAYKENYQQEFVPDLETEMRMKEILPKELSRYFFFDGERIEKMSKEIHQGKSKEFSQAVRSLLGLDAFVSALNHLNAHSSKYSVIKHYNNSFDSSSDSRIREYTRKIEKNLDRINRINDRIEKIGFEEDIAREQCSKLTNIINLHEPTMKYAQDKVRLVNKRENTAQLTKEKRNQVIKYFNTEATSYFSVKLMEDALKELKSVDKLDKGIPDIHARTIQFLIERKICLCGTKIDFGSQQYNELNRLLEFIPPHSIGYIINEFAIRCEDKSKIGTSFLENFQDKYRILRTYETERNDHQDKIIIIEDHLKNRPDIGVVQRDLNNYEKALRNLQEERGQLNSEKGGLETTNERTEADLNKLTIKDENNRKIESFKAYAHRMYDLLGKQYKEKETQTREALSVAINDIFKKIYHGGFSLSLDEKYNIQINSDDYKEFTNSIETSTAQSISIIFAFIAGVIQMARENDNTLGNSDNGEAYPLVMDAPLSAFDKARIKTVCDTIPRIAEQVVIFIKDTDGELAEKHLEAKIGKQYYFDKKNEFETYLIER